MATRVGRLGSVPVYDATRRVSRGLFQERGTEVAEGALTVAFGQFFLRDWVILWRVQLDGHLGLEALGLRFVFDHREGWGGRVLLWGGSWREERSVGRRDR